jgi:hypothetical protein
MALTMLHGLTGDTGTVFGTRGGLETTERSCESSTTAAHSQRLPREFTRRRDMNGVRLEVVLSATIAVLLCIMLVAQWFCQAAYIDATISMDMQ